MSVSCIIIYIVREDLPKLSYTTMCIKESLRLYPPVPYIAKGLSEDFYVEGKRIPKGTYDTGSCHTVIIAGKNYKQ